MNPVYPGYPTPQQQGVNTTYYMTPQNVASTPTPTPMPTPMPTSTPTPMPTSGSVVQTTVTIQTTPAYVPPPQPQPQQVPVVAPTVVSGPPSDFVSPPFYIKSLHNGLVLDVKGDGRAPGTPVITWTQKFGPSALNQLWRWRRDGMIQSMSSGLVLDVANSFQDVIVFTPHGGPNQCWTLNDHYFLTSQCNNKVLDIANENRSPGANIIVWDRHGRSNQQWFLEFLPNRFFIRSRKNGLVLDVQGESRAPGTPVIMWTQKSIPSASNQLWRFRSDGQIESCQSGLVLDVSGSNKHLIIWNSHGGPNQRWTYDGRHLISFEGGLVADIKNDRNDPGAELIAWPRHGGLNQQFDLVIIE
jgi:hypothetical protein